MAGGAGLRQAITLDDVRPGALRPALHRRLVQRVGARQHQLQSLPVGLVRVLVVLQIFVERRNAVEHSGAVTLHRFQDRLGIRAGEEHQQVPLAQPVEHDHDLAVDVEERQEGEDHLLARLEIRERRLSHRLRRDQVRVRQHHALRIAGGAAGIGQCREVGVGIDRDRGRLGGILLEQILQPVDLAGHLGLLAEQALQRGEVLVDIGDDHQIERRARFRHLLIEDVLADDGAGAAVLELVAHFVAGVDRADRRHGRAAFQRREVGDDELRAVEQVQGDALAFLHSQRGQGSGKAVGGVAQLPKADRAAVEHDRRPVGGALGRLVEGLGERLGWNLDRRRHALLVMGEPGPCEIRLDCGHR